MNKHLKYLSYVVRHKFYVAKECFKVGLFWRGITHDLSTFLPSEWFAYTEYFYGDKDKQNRKYLELQHKYSLGELIPYGLLSEDKYNIAWLRHQHRNDHHWQYWILQKDDGPTINMLIDPKALLEMVCDWRGAGKAQGNPDTKAWYIKNKDKIQLRVEDRKKVEELLGVVAEDVDEFWQRQPDTPYYTVTAAGTSDLPPCRR